MITKSYIEGVKQRIKLIEDCENKRGDEFGYHVHQLIDYLEGLDYFLEEEKKQMTCTTCHNPLYVRQDGSLVCVELHH
jgi:uncharacterized paraquat-inducible protein A